MGLSESANTLRKRLHGGKSGAENAQRIAECFFFYQRSFGDSQEMLLLVTGITADNTMTTFIAENGCPAYFQYSEMLYIIKKKKNLQKACAEAIQAI